jgi:hypothetical protein
MHWLTEHMSPFDLTLEKILLGLLLFGAASVGGMALLTTLLIRLPTTYFVGGRPREFWEDKLPILRWTGRVLKNALGIAAVVVGVMLSLPGIPGPGLLLILLGVTLVDFPGKRRVERWLLGRPIVLNTINRLRLQYGRPPLVLEKLGAKPSGPDDRGGTAAQWLVARPPSGLASHNGAPRG